MVVGSSIVASRYRVDRELGRGPHGRTELATDLRNGRPCVLRRLSVAEAAPEEVRRFEARAALLARLDNPGLPRFIDGFFEGEGAARERVVVTSYHAGESLGRMADRGRPLGEMQALAVLRRLVPVLVYLHGFDPPLVHRGIDPAGVIVGPDGRPCLTDLDYAAAEPDGPAAAPAPPGPGDLARAAPEVFMGQPVPASDIYALGLALLRGMTVADPAELVGENARTRLRESLRVSESFAAVLARMLEPALEKRYSDAKALDADLTRIAGGRAPAVARSPERVQERATEEPAAPRRGGRTWVVAAAAVALMLAAAFAVKLRTPPGPEQQSLPVPPTTEAPGAPVALVAPTAPAAPAEAGISAPPAPAAAPEAGAATPAVAPETAPPAQIAPPPGGSATPTAPAAPAAPAVVAPAAAPAPAEIGRAHV
jgi:hypothetical protein